MSEDVPYVLGLVLFGACDLFEDEDAVVVDGVVEELVYCHGVDGFFGLEGLLQVLKALDGGILREVGRTLGDDPAHAVE